MTRKRHSTDPPILTDEIIDWILTVPKPIDGAAWQRLKTVTYQPIVGQESCDLTHVLDHQPVRGTFRIYTRVGYHHDDYSTGLIYYDLEGNSYTLLRCNGPNHSHPNKIERDRITMTAHVHRLTERYQQARRFKDDGYATATDKFNDPPSALIRWQPSCVTPTSG